MTSDPPVYFSPEFIRDFKDLSRKYDNFPEDFDRILEAMRMDGLQSLRIPNMPKGCQGFSVQSTPNTTAASSSSNATKRARGRTRTGRGSADR